MPHDRALLVLRIALALIFIAHGWAKLSGLSGFVDFVGSLGIPAFTYFDKNGTQVSNYTKIGDVRFITENIYVDVDPNRTPTPISLKSSAALRNLVGR